MTETLVEIERRQFESARLLLKLLDQAFYEFENLSVEGRVSPGWAVPKLLEIAQLAKDAFGTVPVELVHALRQLSEADLLGCMIVPYTGEYCLYEQSVIAGVPLGALVSTFILLQSFTGQYSTKGG